MSNVNKHSTSTKFFPPPLDLSQYAVNRVSASKTPSPVKKRRVESSSAPSISSRSSPVPSEADELSRARLQSSMRVISIWNSLEAKYSKGLADDDIIDLATGTIIQDTGVLRSIPDGKWVIGSFAGADQDHRNPDAGKPSGDAQSDEDDGAGEEEEEDFEGWTRIDEQFIDPPPLPRVAPPKSYVSFSSLTRDEEDDLNQFLRAEAQRRAREGDIDTALDALMETEDESGENGEREANEEGSSDVDGDRVGRSEALVEEEDETSADELNLVDPVSRGRSLTRGVSRAISRAPSIRRQSAPSPPSRSSSQDPDCASSQRTLPGPQPSPRTRPATRAHPRSVSRGPSSLREKTPPINRRPPSVEIGESPEPLPPKIPSPSPSPSPLSLSSLPKLELLPPSKRYDPLPNPQNLQTPPISHASVEPTDTGSTSSPSPRKARKTLQFDPVIQYSDADELFNTSSAAPSSPLDRLPPPSPDVRSCSKRKRRRESRSPSSEPEEIAVDDDPDPLDGFSEVAEQYVTPEYTGAVTSTRVRGRASPTRSRIRTWGSSSDLNNFTTHFHHSPYRPPFPPFPPPHESSMPPDPNILAHVMHSINYLALRPNFASTPQGSGGPVIYPPYQHPPSTPPYPYYPYSHHEMPPLLHTPHSMLKSSRTPYPLEEYSQYEYSTRASGLTSHSLLVSGCPTSRQSREPGSKPGKALPERHEASHITPKLLTRRQSFTKLARDDQDEHDESEEDDVLPSPSRAHSRIPRFKKPSGPSPSNRDRSVLSDDGGSSPTTVAPAPTFNKRATSTTKPWAGDRGQGAVALESPPDSRDRGKLSKHHATMGKRKALSRRNVPAASSPGKA